MTHLDPTKPQPAAQPADDELLAEDLIVAEVSIDGMCGVY